MPQQLLPQDAQLAVISVQLHHEGPAFGMFIARRNASVVTEADNSTFYHLLAAGNKADNFMLHPILIDRTMLLDRLLGQPSCPQFRYPGERPNASPADQRSINAGYNLSSPSAQNPPASDIDYVYLAGRRMVVPGVYTLLVVANSGTPTIRLQVGFVGLFPAAKDGFGHACCDSHVPSSMSVSMHAAQCTVPTWHSALMRFGNNARLDSIKAETRRPPQGS